MSNASKLSNMTARRGFWAALMYADMLVLILGAAFMSAMIVLSATAAAVLLLLGEPSSVGHRLPRPFENDMAKERETSLN